MKIVVISDTHCGNRVGLTPPFWQWGQYALLQHAMWDWYTKQVKQIGRPDILLTLGDLIDGRQEKSGGNDLIVSNRDTQCRMAEECVNIWKAKKVYMVRGTPYHTGILEEKEDAIAANVDAVKIADRLFIDIDGYNFDLAHHVNTGQLPHTKTSGIEKDALHDLLWSTREDGHPPIDVILRGHSHIYKAIDDEDGLRMLCPGLQQRGSKFGDQKCRGRINCGIITINTKPKRGGLTWQKHLAKLPAARWEVLKA